MSTAPRTFGLVAGLGLGFAIFALIELRDKSIHSEEDIWEILHMPTLAVLSQTNLDPVMTPSSDTQPSNRIFSRAAALFGAKG